MSTQTTNGINFDFILIPSYGQGPLDNGLSVFWNIDLSQEKTNPRFHMFDVNSKFKEFYPNRSVYDLYDLGTLALFLRDNLNQIFNGKTTPIIIGFDLILLGVIYNMLIELCKGFNSGLFVLHQSVDFGNQGFKLNDNNFAIAYHGGEINEGLKSLLGLH